MAFLLHWCQSPDGANHSAASKANTYVFEMMNRTALVDLEVHPDGRRSRNHLVEEGSRDAAVQLEHQIATWSWKNRTSRSGSPLKQIRRLKLSKDLGGYSAGCSCSGCVGWGPDCMMATAKGSKGSPEQWLPIWALQSKAEGGRHYLEGSLLWPDGSEGYFL